MAKLLLRFNAAVVREISLTGEKTEWTVGRKPDNDIVIDNPAVSGHHARVVREGESFFIEDLKSTNGTFLRDAKVVKSPLRHKDEVGIAKHVLQYINEQEAAARPAAPAEAVSSDATVVLPRSAKPAAAAPAPAARKDTVGGLRVVAGESSAPSFSLVGLTTYIGKSDQAGVRLKGLFAPDMAASVIRKPDGYILKVLKDKAIKHNGQVLQGEARLKEGDLVEAGNLKLVFFLQDADGPLSG